MNISDFITISPNIQSGEAVFTNTRVPVKILFDYLKGGDSIEEFLNDFPSVKKVQVIELLTCYEQFLGMRTTEYRVTRHEL